MLPKAPISWAGLNRDAVVEMVEWITDGLSDTLGMGPGKDLLRWWVWWVEPVTVPLPGPTAGYVTGHEERIERIGHPQREGIIWSLERLSGELGGQGLLWGIGAVTDSGRVLRLALGVPAGWPDADDGREVGGAEMVRWNSDSCVCRNIFGGLARNRE